MDTKGDDRMAEKELPVCPVETTLALIPPAVFKGVPGAKP